MPKITVLDIEDVDSNMNQMNREQLIQIYRTITNPYHAPIIVDEIIKYKEFQAIMSLLDEKNIYLLAAELAKLDLRIVFLSGEEKAFASNITYLEDSGDTQNKIKSESAESENKTQESAEFENKTQESPESENKTQESIGFAEKSKLIKSEIQESAKSEKLINLKIKTLYNEPFTFGNIRLDNIILPLDKMVQYIVFTKVHELYYQTPFYKISELPEKHHKSKNIDESKYKFLVQNAIISNDCTNKDAIINSINLLSGTDQTDYDKDIVKIIKIRQIINENMVKARAEMIHNKYLLTLYWHFIEKRLTNDRIKKLLSKNYKTIAELLIDLSTSEKKVIEQEYVRFEDFQTKIITCDHLKIYKKFRRATSIIEKKELLYKLSRFIETSSAKKSIDFTKLPMGIITCQVCANRLICSHVIDLINNTTYYSSPRKIRESLKKYIDFTLSSDKYFCKFCGELLFDEEIEDTSFNISSQLEETPLGELIWQELKYAMNGLRFNISNSGENINPEKFIQQTITLLLPWIERAKIMTEKNITLTSAQATATMSIYAAIDVYVLLYVLTLSNSSIELIRPKIKKKKLDIENIKILADHISTIKLPEVTLTTMTNADIRSKISSAYAIVSNLQFNPETTKDNFAKIFEETLEVNPILMTFPSLYDVFHMPVKKILTLNTDNIFSKCYVPNYPLVGPKSDIKFIINNINDSYLRLAIEFLKNGYWQELHPQLFDNSMNTYSRYLSQNITILNGMTQFLSKYNDVKSAAFIKTNYLWYNHAVPIMSLDKIFELPNKLDQSNKSEQLTKLESDQSELDQSNISIIYDKFGNKYKFDKFVFSSGEYSIKDLAKIVSSAEENPIYNSVITDLKTDNLLKSELKPVSNIVEKIQIKYLLQEYYNNITNKCINKSKESTNQINFSHKWENDKCTECGLTKQLLKDALDFENITDSAYEELLKYYNEHKDIIEQSKIIEQPTFKVADLLENKSEISEIREESANLLKWKSNPSIVSKFANIVEIDEKQLAPIGEITNRDNPNIYNLLSLCQTIMTEYNCLLWAADLSRPEPIVMHNIVAYFRENFKFENFTKSSIQDLYLAAKQGFIFDPPNIYQYILELISATFADVKGTMLEFIKYEINKYLSGITSFIPPKGIVKIWTREVAPTNDLLPVQTGEDVMANQFDMDTGPNNEIDELEDNIEGPEQ